MPLDPSVQAEIDAYLASKIVKVRIPELPPNTTYGDVSLLDRMALWMNGTNKTVWTDLVTLKAILTTGGTGTITPVLTGDKIIHEVTSAEAGGNTVLIPELAGKTFFLRLEGRPVKPSEFTILNAGGFKMNDVATGVPYELTEGQRFDLEVYELQAGTSGTPAALSSSYIVGIVEVSSNTTLNGINHANKWIELRGGSTQITLTLPDIATTPENAVFIVEACIGNDYQNKITTQGGQFIYMNGSSWTNLWIGQGETAIVARKSDGWYVIGGDMANAYRNLAKITGAYKVGLGELQLNGGDQLKTLVPRLWEEVQSMGGALTTDPAVYAANKGMWLDKDTDTITLPDLRNMFLRGINGGTPGTFQDETVNINAGVKGVKVTGINTIASTVDSTNSTGQEFDLTHVFVISDKQGTETRPVNMGVMWVIKY
jgi:hypothetical protein